MKENGDFVAASTIYFGEWLSIEDVSEEATPDNPESILLAKEAIEELPKECRTLVAIAMGLPEEMYMLNGRIKKSAFQSLVKAKTGWTHKEIKRTEGCLKRGLRKSIQNMIN